jgi:hypothetical protein
MAQMVSKHRLLILIPAIILILLFLGLPPLNKAHKLSKGNPFGHCKYMQLGTRIFDALGSQDKHAVASLQPTGSEQESTRADNFIILNITSIYYNISLDSVPLRC